MNKSLALSVLATLCCLSLVRADDDSIPDNFDQIVEAHGIVGSLAWVFLLPLAVIVLRVVPGRAGFWLHVALATTALALIITNVGMGLWVAIVSDQVCEFCSLYRFITC